MRSWPDRLWTRSERQVVALLLAGLLGLLAYRFLTRPAHLADPLPPQGARAHEIDGRIDPNTATWEQLALLPGIGEKRARTIVAYREQATSDRPDRLPFATLDDLENVHGVGPAMVENLAPYLLLPGEPGH